jgi:hypothetical protein
MQIRDRIREFRRVKASDLRPNPKNWRTHPPAQQAALRALLAEVGYADTLLAHELDDGSLELIDGHLRAELTPDCDVPVLVLDVTPEESDKLLALLDPLAGMARTNHERLSTLLGGISTESAGLQRTLGELLEQAGRVAPDDWDEPENDEPMTVFQVVAECNSEEDQRALFERLRSEGYTCRLLSL